ncbi:MAG: hypothetical protein ACI9ZX_000525, partial [Algoriphagus sp.]
NSRGLGKRIGKLYRKVFEGEFCIRSPAKALRRKE